MLPRRMFLDNMLEDLEKEDNMKCDIYEKKGIIHIEMDIPSFDKKDINNVDIQIKNTIVNIIQAFLFLFIKLITFFITSPKH